MLSKNTDVHRKQRKSLSPEKKVNMKETNAAAHKKQCKSLSADDKDQILNKNADAHKKNASLFYLKIETYLKRIILLHNTNIASPFLLIRKLTF
jgi:hypothetical protein